MNRSEEKKIIINVRITLLDGKAARLLHRLRQLVQQQLMCVVGWQVDAIEARVSFGEVLYWNIIGEMDGEESWCGSARVAL